jgi:hypothetical protein
MKKVWLVVVGNNFDSTRVIARNYTEAARKALKSLYPPKGERFISKVEYLYEVE